jgi:HEAT repeat protein
MAPELGSRSRAEPRPWWRNLRGPIAILLKDLQDPKPMVRRRAAEALARMGDRRAVAALCFCAKDSAWEVRRACVGALDRLGGDAVLKALHRAGRDGHPVVRLAAAEAIGRHGDAGSVAVLAAMREYTERYGTARDLAVVDEAIARLAARLGS